ncbi:MAG: ParB/RepB/Spo0J family partition protein [Betaproteobacteria bacterium]|nr:ParB/RepB/Spo0J family partition protein [Betaproteobacteria bacterium]
MNASSASLDFGRDELTETRIQEVAVDTIRPDPDQPRRYFDEEAMSELCASMSLYGLLQPVGVRKAADRGWDLIFGERRLRAAIELGWKTISARVYPVDARKIKTVLQLGENAHRADLSLLEYLGGIDQLRTLGVPAGAIARMLCKPEEWVTALLDISRDPLARSLYESGIMTHVGAWESFCRLPEHLRNGLLQSGEQLTPLRCKRALDAHEAQKPARQLGLIPDAEGDNRESGSHVDAEIVSSPEIQGANEPGFAVVTTDAVPVGSADRSEHAPVPCGAGFAPTIARADTGAADSAGPSHGPVGCAAWDTAATIRVEFPVALAQALLPGKNPLDDDIAEAMICAISALLEGRP